MICAAPIPAPAQDDPVEGDCLGVAPGPRLSVVRIVDGETIALDDGSQLRLIGALAPRAIDVGAEPGLWPIEVAAREELGALVLGKSVEIAFGGDRRDRYGRLVGHAFVVDGGRRRWVQGHMLLQGLARAYGQAGNRACTAELLAAEAAARQEQRGLWADAAYRIRAARNVRELSRYAGTFQVVEGRAVRISAVRGRLFVALGGRRRGAFSVSMPEKDSELLGLAGTSAPEALEGRLLRVRGWIEQGRGGPSIDISAAGNVEVLEDAGAGAAASLPPSPSRPALGPRDPKQNDAAGR